MEKTQATDDSLVKDKECDTEKENGNTVLLKLISENDGEKELVEKQLPSADENEKHEQYSEATRVRKRKYSHDDKDQLTAEDTDNRNLGTDDIVSPNITFSKDGGVKKRDMKQLINNDENNKLEEYLKNIYNRECKFSCDDKDVQFIQSSVETLVNRIIDMRFSKLRCLSSYCNMRHTSPELLKVGSYYEHTKNKFPNEFDYIVVIGTVENLPKTDMSDHELGKLSNEELSPIKNKCSTLSFLGCLGRQGPADMYGFCFQKGDVVKTITVDISTALRYIYTTEIHERKNIVQTSEVFHPEFHKAILDTKSFLLLDFNERINNRGYVTLPWKVCVTETEMQFVKNNVSEKHKKVYMLLKYLINGNFDSGLLRDISFFFSICISSYSIKTAVLYHHFKCKNEGSTVSDCVLDILKYFHNKLSTSQPLFCGWSSAFPDTMPETLIQFQVIESVNATYETFETSRPDSRFMKLPGERLWYSAKTKLQPLIRASKRDINSISSEIFHIFLDRLESLKLSTNLNKCSHTVNDSVFEMLLECPAVKTLAAPRFTEIINAVEKCIQNKTPTVENKFFYDWLKAEKIVNCSWCNYASSSLIDLTLEATKTQTDLDSLDPDNPDSFLTFPQDSDPRFHIFDEIEFGDLSDAS